MTCAFCSAPRRTNRHFQRTVALDMIDRFLLRFLSVLLLLWAGEAKAAGTKTAPYDPTKIVENETQDCAQCHERAVAAWKRSRHKLTYDELHLEERAQEILKKMGGKKSIRRNKTCIECHFTQVRNEEDARTKTILGISCQRCHGAARDWADVHQDAEHYPDRGQRLELARERGLHSRANLYDLARMCYECHTVPKENLVNVGSHHAGSEGFELVEWMYGEARHNFLPLPEQETNMEPSLEKRRLLFVLGQMLELEFGLRGVAAATRDGPFLDAIGPRLKGARDLLKGLKLGVSEVDAILAEIPSGDEELQYDKERRAALLASADRIRQHAKAFEKNQAIYAGRLAVVDSFLRTEYRGNVFE